jgi:hypothetical protein
MKLTKTQWARFEDLNVLMRQARGREIDISREQFASFQPVVDSDDASGFFKQASLEGIRFYVFNTIAMLSGAAGLGYTDSAGKQHGYRIMVS